MNTPVRREERRGLIANEIVEIRVYKKYHAEVYINWQAYRYRRTTNVTHTHTHTHTPPLSATNDHLAHRDRTVVNLVPTCAYHEIVCPILSKVGLLVALLFQPARETVQFIVPQTVKPETCI